MLLLADTFLFMNPNLRFFGINVLCSLLEAVFKKPSHHRKITTLLYELAPISSSIDKEIGKNDLLALLFLYYRMLPMFLYFQKVTLAIGFKKPLANF